MLQIPKHREIMFYILRDIFSSEYAPSLAFKGGTLCYFLYGLDRFSTDLDIDLIHPVDDESIFLAAIESLLTKYGNIKEKIRKRSTFFFLLSYGETDMNIKIEINTRIWKENKYESVNLFGQQILAQERSTVFANKLVALTDRTTLANRDIFDVYFFFRNIFPINESLIEERTGKNIGEYLVSLREYLMKHVSKKNLLSGLGEVLDPKQKVFVKEKLFDELMGILEFQIATH